jgi:hypothetical protein
VFAIHEQSEITLRRSFWLALIIGLTISSAAAQPLVSPQAGEPPVSALIAVSAPDERGLVVVEGAPGAAPPALPIAIRNLNTLETLYTRTSVTGAFSVSLFGPGPTPFLIMPFDGRYDDPPLYPGALPGGPGVIIYGEADQAADPSRFIISGSLGASHWWANGRTSDRMVEPGAIWTLELDVQFPVAALPPDALLSGTVSLQPVAAGAPIPLAIADRFSNNGWSNVLTAGGLPLDNLAGGVDLDAEALAEPLSPLSDGLRFRLRFAVALPDDLPAGLYVPIFQGYIERGGQRQRWEEADMFGTRRDRSAAAYTRLPLVLTVSPLPATIPPASLPPARMPLALLVDETSTTGGRGALAEEDAEHFALSNRVAFNPPALILPAGSAETPARYSLEPYLLNLLPNAAAVQGAPLIPLDVPGGRLAAVIRRPDGRVDRFEGEIAGIGVSSAAADETARFGSSAPVDTARLLTNDSTLGAYPFDVHGDYTIVLTAEFADRFGNRYEGGGTYRVIIAEPLLLLPAALPGTPFAVGDVFHGGLTLVPGVPAEISGRLRIFPFYGTEPIEHVFEGQANPHGYFYPAGAPFIFMTPGEYVVDYEARYRDADGRLWAASVRGAGVITGPESGLIARGRRGLAGYENAQPRPAWYSIRQLASAAGTPAGGRAGRARPYLPFHSGDMLWLNRDQTAGLEPLLTVQDLAGDYAGTLFALNAASELEAVHGELPLEQILARGHRYGPGLLPAFAGDEGTTLIALANDAYWYFSAVRPGIAARQFVAGSAGGGLDLGWLLGDPYNRQIGAGLNGDLPGDHLFLFGGAVVRGGESGGATASYAALAVVLDHDDPRGARVLPPGRGRDGGADGGPVLVIDDRSQHERALDLFFQPTAIRPGQLLRAGDIISVAGQIGPPLSAEVRVTITAPDGSARTFSGQASPTGYFYMPTGDLAAEQPGVWTIAIRAEYAGATSAGLIEGEGIEGGVPGAARELSGAFQVFVLAEDALPLSWSAALRDARIPAALPYNFSYTLPEGWANARVYRTLATPSLILEDGELRLTGRSFSYAYTPNQLRAVFPNLELEGRVNGVYVSDAKTLTLVVVGADGGGRERMLYRAFTILHDRLISLER